MVTRMVRLGASLNGVEQPELELDITRGLPDEARQVAVSTALGAISNAVYEAWHAGMPADRGPAAATAQPQDITRFNAATFSWRGGSNAVDNPVVAVERLVDGQWVRYADQTGEVQTRVDFPNGTDAFSDTYSGSQEWIWTANFEAFNAFPAGIGSTPEGVYRFVVDGKIRTGLQGTPYGGADTPYSLESEPFEVKGWDGVEVTDLRVESDGSTSFTVPAIAYPTSYEGGFPYISTAVNGFCMQCTFRSWASGADVATALVSVIRADGTTESVPATLVDGRWVAPTALQAGDVAYVAAGGVTDTYGETNATATQPVAVEAVSP